MANLGILFPKKTLNSVILDNEISRVYRMFDLLLRDGLLIEFIHDGDDLSKGPVLCNDAANIS